MTGCTLRVATIALTTVIVAACASRNATTSGPPPKPASQFVIERLPDPIDASSFTDVTASLLAPRPPQNECAPVSIEEARRRYLRLRLDEADDYERVRFELERSYELCPSVKVLYSLARVEAQLNANARAHALYERYLEDGEPPPQRVAEIRADLARIETRLGWVLVECGEGIDHVLVDDHDLSQLGPCPFRRKVRTDFGRRVVRADGAPSLAVDGSTTTAVSVHRHSAR